MPDPVAWSGKRGWDVILLDVPEHWAPEPRESTRKLPVTTIPPADDRPEDERIVRWEQQSVAAEAATRDLADVPAVEVITTTAVHLMSAAAVKVGLADEPGAQQDLDEARKLINALAGLITAGAPEISSAHAAPLRDGLRSLQLAFREASPIPDPVGQGPGEKWTGPVS